MSSERISLDDVFVRHGEEVGMERGMFIIALSEEKAFGLSPLAYVVWYMCDGRLPLRAVVENIAENANVDANTVEKRVLEVVQELMRVGLLTKKQVS